MEILVFNLETTSLQYKLFGVRKVSAIKSAPRITLKLLKQGRFDNLGENKKMRHEEAIRQAIRKINDLTEIGVIAHRIVYGGNDFLGPVIVGPNFFKTAERYNELLSSYNKYGLLGIKTCLAYFGRLPNIAVFDTTFFKDLPLKSKVYALPFDFYLKYGLEKFGFKGMAHQQLTNEAARKLNKSQSKLKLIIVYIDSVNCIVTAVKNGKPIDTSAGFTRFEGPVGLHNAGDIDPGIIFALQKIKIKDGDRSEHKNTESIIQETQKILESESGIMGVSGNDNFLKVLQNAKKHPRYKLASEIFIYRLQKYMSAYWGILGGADAIIFSGEIAQLPVVRKNILKDLKFLKRAKILSIKIDEELAMAQECVKFLKV